MKTVLISGGSSGLGKALAAELVSSHRVVILARDEQKTIDAAKEVGCEYVVADVTDASALKNAVEDVIKRFENIDVLVNNAGVWIQGPIEQNDPEHIKQTIDTNTTGTILLTHFVLPHMKAKSSGRIINVVSQAGLYAKKERSVYAASKWAITGFTKALQDELARTGINVTGFYPGPMRTELFAAAGVEKDMSKSMGVTQVSKMMRHIIESPDDVVVTEYGINPTFY